MVHACCVYMCRNRATKNTNISFHGYTQWLINIGRTDLDVTDVKSKRVCSVHFPTDAYSCPNDIAYSRLLPSALPTIFVNCLNPLEGLAPSESSSTEVETPIQQNLDVMENSHHASTSGDTSGDSDSTLPPADDQKPSETQRKKGKKRTIDDDIAKYLHMVEENRASEKKKARELQQLTMAHIRDQTKAIQELITQCSSQMSSECKMKVDVVLPAAGSSERMNLPDAKQYLRVLGKHIIAYTVDCFQRFSWVRHIVVVVRADQLEFARQLLDSYGFKQVILCVGGETRHRSIHCGIQALHAECTSSDVVIIHDGARPFVPEEVALQVAEAAKKHGAAGVTRNLVSTVINADEDGKLVESLDRRLYRNSEMPQAFQYGIIANAYEKCTDSDLDFGTECLLLAMKYSQCRAFLVPGTDDLWKVTYRKDVYSMESTVKEKFTVVSIINSCKELPTAFQDLQQKLELTQIKMGKTDDEPANTFVLFIPKCVPLTELQSWTSKISGSYNKLSHSAVGLDLFVIFVFLGGQTMSGQICTTDAGYSQSQSVWQKNSNDVKPGNSTLTLHGNAENLNNSAVSDMSESRAQYVQKSKEQQRHEIDLFSIKQEPTESPSTSAILLSDIVSDDRCMDHWFAVLKNLKGQLQRGIGEKSVIAIGVQCEVESPVGEHLADMIWQRSTVLDGQVLTFD